MTIVAEVAYSVVLFLIHSYKWLELQLCLLFNSQIEKVSIYIMEKHGIVCQRPRDTKQDILKKEQRALSKTKHKGVCNFKIKTTDKFFPLMVSGGSLALGEAYMNGDWDFPDTKQETLELLCRIFDSGLPEMYFHPWNRFLNHMELRAFNLQTRAKSFDVGRSHYDLGNDLFESFLDPWMQYTCGYWAKADNLNDAQIAKMDLIARKLELKPGMRVLDVGCGWGLFCKYLAEKYQVTCVGISVGAEGIKYGSEKCKGLPVELRLQDYRDVNEQFDRIVSVGMIEHVGSHNFKEFYQVMRKCLKDDGIFLAHFIGLNHSNLPKIEPWTHTYIFPNGQIPYFRDVTKGIEGQFIIEDWHNFGPNYSRTLESWHDNFKINWPNISTKYGERFYRMWTYYLITSSAMFKCRKLQLWQLVLSKNGLRTDYRAPR